LFSSTIIIFFAILNSELVETILRSVFAHFMLKCLSSIYNLFFCYTVLFFTHADVRSSARKCGNGSEVLTLPCSDTCFCRRDNVIYCNVKPIWYSAVVTLTM